VAAGVLAPAGVLACWRALRVLDHRMRARDVDVALLQRIAMLRPLPQVTIEQLAARLTRVQLPAGASVLEQGDEGDDFYVIERGRAEVVLDGQSIRALGPGECFGEIALVRDCARTASVRATTALTLRTLNRAVVVAAVAGYPPSRQVADDVITGHLQPGGIGRHRLRRQQRPQGVRAGRRDRPTPLGLHRRRRSLRPGGIGRHRLRRQLRP
jgi:hypothetical protein